MGWYHCIPVSLYGNDSEEIILYDPYSDEIFLYGSNHINNLIALCRDCHGEKTAQENL